MYRIIQKEFDVINNMNSLRLFLFFIIGLSILLFSACGDDCEEQVKEFTWSPNKSIEIVSDSVLIHGSMINIIEYIVVDSQDVVFEYYEINQSCDSDILDGIGIMNFSMAIPADSTSAFSYTGSEILTTSAFVDIFMGPVSLSHQFVEEGEIVGTKIDESRWQVSIDVITSLQEYGESVGEQNIMIDIDTIFSLK